jgi:hypothetical protein
MCVVVVGQGTVLQGLARQRLRLVRAINGGLWVPICIGWHCKLQAPHIILSPARVDHGPHPCRKIIGKGVVVGAYLLISTSPSSFSNGVR